MVDSFDRDIHCHDCGGKPKWKHADFGGYEHYCKRCLVQNGYYTGVTIDIDKLEAIVGAELTVKVLSKGNPGGVLW